MEGRRNEGVTLGFVAQSALVVIGIWAIANMLWLGREVVFIAFFAVLVASFLSIIVGWLEKVGIPRGLAAPVVLLSVVALIGGLFYLAWPALREQLMIVQRQVPEAIGDVERWFERQYQGITGQFGEPDQALVEQIRQRWEAEAGRVVGGALPLLNTLAGAVAGLFIVVFAGLFLAIEPRTYARGLALLVPRSARPDFTDALLAVGEKLRSWMLGTLISMITIGVLTTIGLLVIGIPAALVLGLIAGLLEFIPYFGPFMSGLPALAIALTISPSKALWVLVLYTAIQQIESNVVHPLIMKGVVKLHPALTILTGALMAVLFGFLGLLLAVPILVAVKVLVQKLYVEDVTEKS